MIPINNELISKIKAKEANIGIIGMGYVGLHLALHFLEAGFDIDPEKVKKLSRGESYITHIPSSRLTSYPSPLTATTDMERLSEMDAILICVPTPLTDKREPDMRYIEGTIKDIASVIRPGQIISLESTTYPGTTEELLLPILEKNGLKVGEEFFLVYSPEREDPGNGVYNTRNIPKVIGGVTEKCLSYGIALYSEICEKVVPVLSTRAAEATKLLENIYRAVNIAMVNELKMLFDRMGIDIFEVIEAAKTKPFGFQPFYPGPGLGGHCIPVDPFYLTWKAREYDFPTRFIELAGEINTHMPYYVVQRVVDILNNKGKSIKGARILLLGIAYKKNVDDQRESPALKIIQLLKKKGAEVSYHDPFVPHSHGHRSYPDLDLYSQELSVEYLKGMDCVIITTDHDNLDYQMVFQHSSLIVDTRNVMARWGLKDGRKVVGV